MNLPTDLQVIAAQLDAAERETWELVSAIDSRRGETATGGAWSVAQILDHVAVANRVYLQAMQPAAARAREQGKQRNRPAKPGIGSRLFLGMLEPPVRGYKAKAPPGIRPQSTLSLTDALAAFSASQNEARAFLLSNADLDLAHVRFANPFIRGIRFTLSTGLLIIPAHERRQIRQIRQIQRSL